METVVSLIAIVACAWLVLNTAYHVFREKFVSRGFKLYYGLLLVYKRENVTLRSVQVLSRLSYALIVVFVLTLMYFYLILVLNIFNRLAGVEGSVRLLVPGVNIRGIQLLYFLLSLLIAASIHELAHALTARANGVKVKSIGFAALPILALAFVEVDDESFLKLPRRSKTSILSAGPVSNFFFGLLALLMLNMLVDPYGLVIVNTIEGGFAEKIGLRPYDILVSINNQPINTSTLRSIISVNEEINLTICVSRGGEIEYINTVKPRNVTQLGVWMVSKPRDTVLKLFGLRASLEALSFMNWFYIVNISLSFINALPIFLSDGGRIVYEAFRSKRLATMINVFSLLLLIVSLISSSLPIT